MTEKDPNDLKFSDDLGEEKEKTEIPTEERKLVTQAYDKSVSDLVTLMNDEEIILNPEYQREYIWDNKKASLLIESILLNVPIPVIYMSEEEDGKWSVIDGLQRLYSLQRFFLNEFKLTSLEVLTELNRHTFKDLNPKAKRIIKNGIIRIILIFKESHPEIKYDIFMRLNRGAVKLSEQELRNCLYRGKLNDLIKTLREDKKYLAILGLKKPHKRMTDAELILRYLSLSENMDRSNFTLKTYPGKMKTFLNDFLDDHRNPNDAKLSELKTRFLTTLEKVNDVFGKNAFRKIYKSGSYDKALNRSIMDSVMIGFENYDRRILSSKKEEIVKLLQDLINGNDKFADSISVATSDKKKIQDRVRIFSESLSQIFS
jgi:uncharacterized protein with ParB-like and HNH nuclease domain